MRPRTILITGATRGIGRHAALTLAARGHHVFATGRDEAVLAALRATAPALTALPLDVVDPASIAAATREIDRLTAGRGVDALVNNAGHAVAGPVVELDDDALARVFEVNVLGLVRVTRVFAQAMIRRGEGRIINVGSVCGRFSLPLGGAYHGSKWAVATMSDSLRMELRDLGVDVVLIEPGTIRTGFLEDSCRAAAAAAPPGSPFARAYARLEQRGRQIARQAVDPVVTSRAIAHAIEAPRPRARYVTPLRARLITALLRRLPTSLADALLIEAAGLRRPGEAR